ncbi:phosphoribosylaminoimidazolesuccinocarboxamide synthase [Flavobacterium sp.]|uniref:phosphoribosylaminoimidazolesuccinocarboxamide synthase n=1 Tax=Flavobacterium sp. TaxID=239 RepID=UPI003F69D62F
MIEEMYKSFETKTEFCHVFTDKIVFSRDINKNNISRVVASNNIKRVLIIYGLISIFLFYKSYAVFIAQDYVFFVFFISLGLYFVYGILTSRNSSTTSLIYRNSIKEVVFVKAKPYLTRAYFEVYFTDENSTTKKRLIMLPGSFSNGKSETEKALKIFKEEGLIS